MRRLLTADVWLVIGSAILALLLWAVVTLLSPSPNSPLAGASGGFLVAVIGSLIAAHRNLRKAADEVSAAVKQSEVTSEAVRKYLHVTRLGTPPTAISYVASRLPLLREVRNTSFNVDSMLDRPEIAFYGGSEYQEFRQAQLGAIRKGTLWWDIGDKFAVQRMRFTARDSNNAVNYRYKVINSEPQLNFAILTYHDGVEEVLFNWDYRSGAADPTVLVSRDSEVLNMFIVQFTQLQSFGSRDHDQSL